MMPNTLRGAAALAVVAALAAGCGGSEPPAAAGDTPLPKLTDSPAERTTAPQTGPMYALSGSLCAKADQSAITKIYPKQDGQPLVDTQKLCIISWKNSTQSFTLTVDADVTPEEQSAKDWVEEVRQRSKYPSTDVTGVGTMAFWQEVLAGKEVRLTSYHGNLVLRIEGSITDKSFPKDVRDRLTRVAVGTYQRLAP